MRHPLIRVVAIFMLAWISIDLCWLDVCPTDDDESLAVVSVLTHSDSCGPTHDGILHPHDCCCHAHYVALARTAPLATAAPVSYLAASSASMAPAVDLTPLYHPPQAAL